jgi:hypothetical protein
MQQFSDIWGTDPSNFLRYFMDSLNILNSPDNDPNIPTKQEIKKMEDGFAKKEAVRKRRARATEMRYEKKAANKINLTLAPKPQLHPTFDSSISFLDRYRYIENRREWIIRPDLQDHSPEHDDGIQRFTVVREMSIRPPGNYLGGLPFRCSLTMQNEKPTEFQCNLMTTMGLDVLPLFCNLLETTKLNMQLHVQSNAREQSKGEPMLCIFRCDSQTEEFLKPDNKVTFGLLMSCKSAGVAKLKGPLICGAKIEDILEIKDNLKAHLGLGICRTGLTNQKNQSKTVRGKIIKETNNSRAIVEVCISWFRLKRDIEFKLQHQQSLTPGTNMDTEVNYHTLAGTGKIKLQLSSVDHNEISLSSFLPVAGLIVAKIRHEPIY